MWDVKLWSYDKVLSDFSLELWIPVYDPLWMTTNMQRCHKMTWFSGVLWGTMRAGSSPGPWRGRGSRAGPGSWGPSPHPSQEQDRLGRIWGIQLWPSDTSMGRRTGRWPMSWGSGSGPVKGTSIRPILGWPGRAVGTGTGQCWVGPGRNTMVTQPGL